MLALQGLVEKARCVSGEVQKGIIRAGLPRHHYPFEPRQKQVDAIWHLVSKKEDLHLTAKTSFARVPYSRQRRCFVTMASALSSSLWIELDRSSTSRSKGFLARDPCLSMARRTRLIHWPKILKWGCTLISLWVQRSQPVGFGR
ncbi:hypothetical protein BJ878DRAFT_65355 [Calycina marina]|uniref:Uncharacterized protein n=1 Tax=Calycina marina TaxID=1763456 RepID=A0A9P8CF97_9HELO|nr:hypothetical protein BJ878DRAFT_65355 [Calycina marina]